MYDNPKIPKYKFQTGIIVVALAAVLVGLVVISAWSLWQTIVAFSFFSDPSFIMAGLPLGAWLPVAFGLVFQYGQNAALYVRKHYCTDEPVFDDAPNWLHSKNIALFVFAICAVVDASTNIFSFNNAFSRLPGQETLGLLKLAGNIVMVAIVFVEEVVGITLQAFAKAKAELKSIVEAEKRIKSGSAPRPVSRNLQPSTSGYGGRPAGRFGGAHPVSVDEPVYEEIN